MPDITELVERSKLNFKEKALSVQITENNEALLSRPELEQLGFICMPFWEDEGDLEGEAYKNYIEKNPDFDLQLRREVALRLVRAEKLLPSNQKIVIKAGFRPYDVQMELLKSLTEDIRRRQPKLSATEALKYARSYVADPRLVCPPHTTGGAVDIAVVDVNTGAHIDMGCPPNTDDERATLHSSAITTDQYNNRLILLRAMLQAGFAPLHNEWWHYSYGETRWAAFYNLERSIYGIIR